MSAAPARSESDKTLRSWVTSVTIGSFLLIGVTGVLMFFEVSVSSAGEYQQPAPPSHRAQVGRR